MPPAAALRLQIESALADKIPSALTPRPKLIRSVAPTGIDCLDTLLHGGLPVGAISELAGPECSGRTSLALSFLARITAASRVAAWIDVSDAFDPISAAAAGVDLSRLLWIRCGVSPTTAQEPGSRFVLPEKYLIPPPTKQGLHGGGFGPHPRGEAKGLSDAVSDLLRPDPAATHSAASDQGSRAPEGLAPGTPRNPETASAPAARKPLPAARKPWSRIEQAIRSADLLLQGGGFTAIVLDMGSLAPEIVSRVPLATWFRYRAAAERSQTSILLLTQHSSAKSSAELLLRLDPGQPLRDEPTVFTGMRYRIEVVRRRFADEEGNVVAMRKPPQRANTAGWRSRTTWGGCR